MSIQSSPDCRASLRWLAILLLFCIAVPGNLFAQGFQIKPMQMDMTVPAGRISETQLELSNTTTENLTLNIRLVELTQSIEGSWQLVWPDSDVDTSHLSSALTWVSLEKEAVEIGPATTAKIGIRIAVPPNARGAYMAGIIAEQPKRPDATGLVIRVRFLIPVIIQIEGRPVRQNVALDDVSMTYVGGDGEPALRSTSAHMQISNSGQTYSRIQGQLSIDRRSGERWRNVTRLDIKERAIIPGVTLTLGDDLKRRLPSGSYRLRAELNVDGRRVRPVEKEIEFLGDPDVDGVAYDTALILEPQLVELDIAPGAVRAASVSIENPGDDPVRIRIGASTPRSLQGVVMGELLGADLSAEPWTEVRPAEFTLRAHGRQNVRVMSRVPKEGVDHPNYYADLILQGTYADGQSGGETRSMVHLLNKTVATLPAGIVERVGLAEDEAPSQYVVQSRFINTGNIHVEPQLQADLVSPTGGVVASVHLTGDAGPLLPLGVRNYGGSLDLAEVEPGNYSLRVVSRFAEGMDARNQLVLRVDLEPPAQGETSEDTKMIRKITVLDGEGGAEDPGGASAEGEAEQAPAD